MFISEEDVKQIEGKSICNKRSIKIMSSIKIVSGFGQTDENHTKQNLKPTPARVKKQIFSWLRPMKEDIVCLDLFAGSGSLGIEALSNGAKKWFY